MPILMRKDGLKIFAAGLCLMFAGKTSAQSFQTLFDVNNFVHDALWYADTFITPATDGAIYQASSAWVATPEKKKLWDVNVSLHTNIFFVPKSNRRFNISNSDFSFFHIENAASATVPTALGNDDQVYLVGSINDGQNENEVRIKTPEGIDSETVIYPYIQASLGLWHGTEFLAKYSYNVKLKKGHYQVYGAGIKHNISQYFKSMQSKNINLSLFAGYSKEEISFNFLDAKTQQYGALGLNELAGLVDSYQFQVNGSKKWKKFELMAGLIGNVSDVKYKVDGEEGVSSLLIPVQSYINDKLAAIYATKTNLIGELSGRYRFGHFYTQGVVAFGKFINTNISLQYEL